MGKPTGKQKGITFGYCDTATGARVYPQAMAEGLLPEQLPPPQKLYEVTDNSDMVATITCWPPLGQATSILLHEESVRFTVCLETEHPSVLDDDVSVCLWHNHHNHIDWSELPMVESRGANGLVSLRTSQHVSILIESVTARDSE